MQKRCTPHLVRKTYQNTGTWRKTAIALDQLYGVSLSPATWRDYAEGNHDIADLETRARLGLGPRACPGCGRRHTRSSVSTATTAGSIRKQTKPRRIREYGYPPVEVLSFDEVLILREAPR